MPTPLPVKSPASAKPEVDASGEGGVRPSGLSVKLEPPDPTQETLQPGTLIEERYRIDALLGEGGMGKVYAAEHVHMRKQVAIKVLHPEMSTTPEVVARFEREAVAAGKITHPNVAAATDFGRLADRSFFLVLEYVAGTDLRATIAKGALPPERAVHIIRQITAAVGAAHAAGVVHRDLKPENIMLVDRDGDPDFVKVLDFGIAKIDAIGITDTGPTASPTGTPAPQPLTKMGAVFGTPDYMSPEQALGQPIDARSDLYSIGVIFYELLVGHRPFKGGAVTLMRAHVLDAVPSLPPASLEVLGSQYDVVIQRLLQKSATDRFANAADLLAALDELSAEPASEPTAEADAEAGRAATELHLEPMAGPRTAVTGSTAALQPTKRRRAFGPLSWLIILGCTGGGVYWLVEQPTPVAGAISNLIDPPAPKSSAAPPAPSAAAPATSSSPSPWPAASAATASSDTPTPSDTASSSAAPVDSASTGLIEPLGPTETDEMPPTPEESAAPALASSAAPHHLGPHVTQSRPASKPIHKTNKQAPPPKHPFIPPPSQWFKN